MSLILLAVVVLAWGFSWYAITLQVSEASALVALAYRFLIAATTMCVGLIAFGRWRLVPLSDQKWIFAMGFCLFSMNFLCFYLAAPYLPSGLLSVIFATAAVFGAFNAWLFFDKALEARILIAATLGVVGLSLLLHPEIDASEASAAPWWAIALPFVGTMLFSLGNVLSARLSEKYALPNLVGQGMVWGALILVALCLLVGEEFVAPASTVFWAGVLYLALIASLLAFLTYLALINRVGAARASFATVLFPIVAMLVSTWAEGYAWSPMSVLGLAMALGGAAIAFARVA